MVGALTLSGWLIRLTIEPVFKKVLRTKIMNSNSADIAGTSFRPHVSACASDVRGSFISKLLLLISL